MTVSVLIKRNRNKNTEKGGQNAKRFGSVRPLGAAQNKIREELAQMLVMWRCAGTQIKILPELRRKDELQTGRNYY